ncbi:unnamed protein product [Effrenium voratum]|nr:unnamed protein product [Effrenium voratum]
MGSPEKEEDPWRRIQAEAPEVEDWWLAEVASGEDKESSRDRARPSQPGRLAARLVVRESGAGVSLLWCEGEGYLVQEIEDSPGQPELRVGDMLQSIGAVQLRDARSVIEAEARFASAFQDGALLEVHRPCFSVTLKVPKGGAGLALVWHPPEGYLVEAVESIPGQPDLRAGDVLRRVGATALGGFATQQAADRALASALKDGVTARVYRPSCDAQLGDLVAGAELLLPSVGVGTWSWGNESFGSTPEAAKEPVAQAFHAALGRGCYFFDTAPTYGRGFAEESLGYHCSHGHYAFVATKHFPRPGRELAKAVVATAREAASRLQLEGPVDLLQLHRPAEPPCSLEAQADALAAAVKAGAAKAVGVCNFSLAELRAVHGRLRAVHGLRLASCQVELSLARQLPVASGLVNGCRELGVIVLAYSPLAMGRLSGRYGPDGPAPSWWERGKRKPRPFGASLDQETPAWRELLAELRQMGQKYGKTVAQVAINWVLCQGAVAICGARDGRQAAENAGAMGWRLSAEDAMALAARGARGKTSDFQHG